MSEEEKVKSRKEYQKNYTQYKRYKYNHNKAYREKIRRQTRQRYYKDRPTEGLPVMKNRIGKARKFAKYKTVELPDGRTAKMAILSCMSMAKFMMIHYSGLRRWFENGWFPKPTKTFGKQNYGYYTVKEANAMMRAFAKHRTHQRRMTKYDAALMRDLFKISEKYEYTYEDE